MQETLLSLFAVPLRRIDLMKGNVVKINCWSACLQLNAATRWARKSATKNSLDSRDGILFSFIC